MYTGEERLAERSLGSQAQRKKALKYHLYRSVSVVLADKSGKKRRMEFPSGSQLAMQNKELKDRYFRGTTHRALLGVTRS